MTDKEVGELWRWARGVVGERTSGLAPTQPVTGYAETLLNLLRKLVEERALRHHYEGYPCFCDDIYETHIAEALREFGIDPASWN